MDDKPHTQSDLFTGLPTPVDGQRPLPMGVSIQERFEMYCTAHPQVWELFVRFARELKYSGKKKASSKLIIERIRWEFYLGVGADEEFKINNNYTSRYARKLMESAPDEFKDFFETRVVKTI